MNNDATLTLSLDAHGRLQILDDQQRPLPQVMDAIIRTDSQNGRPITVVELRISMGGRVMFRGENEPLALSEPEKPAVSRYLDAPAGGGDA